MRNAMTTLLLAACVAAPLYAAAQQAPKELQPPAGEAMIVKVHAKGNQVYVCKAESDPAGWTLKGPDAQLFDGSGRAFGKHFAGPSWEANDGSHVTGKAVANVASPDADSVPWLLLTVVGRSGDGVLSRVTSIQRINTKGGKAPAASSCDAAHNGQESRSSYSADYAFFAPK
jgi:Protein of unknown function (DUF3455)